MSVAERTVVSDLANPGAPEPLPTQIGGYVLGRQLGQGAMGQVVLGQHPTLGRAAIKILRKDAVGETDFQARFARECAVMAGLDHPGIVKILGHGEDQGRLWLAMELVEGPSLADLLLTCGRLSEGDALRFALHVVRALDHARRVGGLVHRDIKPGNILFAGRRTPKIIDFGLARPVGASSELSMNGVAMGTPSYMAPEQIRGEHVDQRTDLYAVGVMLYESLTGELPFADGQPLKILQRHLKDPIPDPARIVPSLAMVTTRIVNTCLAKVPGGRYADHAACARAIEKALEVLGESQEVELELQVRSDSEVIRKRTPIPRPYPKPEDHRSESERIAGDLRPQDHAPAMDPLEPRPGYHPAVTRLSALWWLGFLVLLLGNLWLVWFIFQ